MTDTREAREGEKAEYVKYLKEILNDLNSALAESPDRNEFWESVDSCFERLKLIAEAMNGGDLDD